jgi:MYXO-CTERM domain-containing protein
VLLSTGTTFKEAKIYDEPYHGWVGGRVVINEVFDEMPESIYVLFEFTGDGQVEGAIDDFRVLDRTGQCAAEFGLCSCDATSGATPKGMPAGVFLTLGLVASFTLRRRRRAA